MKYFWSFLLVILTKLSFAQQDTLQLYQTYTSFSNEAKAEWTAFENNWNYFSYAELKKQQHIKNLNCNNCESFFADLYLEIDAEGKIITVKFLKGKRCGLAIDDKLLEAQFESTLKKQQFSYLKNKAFIARFGHALKC
jgi:hypothetical protein